MVMLASDIETVSNMELFLISLSRIQILDKIGTQRRYFLSRYPLYKYVSIAVLQVHKANVSSFWPNNHKIWIEWMPSHCCTPSVKGTSCTDKTKVWDSIRHGFQDHLHITHYISLWKCKIIYIIHIHDRIH